MRFVDLVCSGLEAWRTVKKEGWDERAYSDELKVHLIRSLHQAAVSRSVVLPNGRIDLRLLPNGGVERDEGTSIVVRSSRRVAPEVVLIEVKRNLTRAVAFQRLVDDQIPKYCEDLSDIGRLVVVLIGRTSPKFLKELRRIEEGSRRNDRWARNSRQIRIIEKPFAS
ncbi:MAG: hypothetical protein FJ096_22115 [Deltaproteobacteria bacterium]|nr:hypothetical protein [Deltaproteobacteria bacterium]